MSWEVGPSAGPPPDLASWARARDGVRATLGRCLGATPPRQPSVVRHLGTERRGSMLLERLSWIDGVGETVPAVLVRPESLRAPAPAVYFCHAHGGRYAVGKDELWAPTALGPSAAELLTGAGAVVLAIDTWCFGERQGRGPGGPRETGGVEEQAEFKRQLWLGRTLWGLMLHDDLLGLDVLRARPEVDASRVAAMGMSMGCTRTWWLAAMDSQLAAAVCVACLTRYQDLLASGHINAHGIYYFVPGLLRHLDTEAIVALAAPTALLTLSGDEDAGAPASGVRTIQEWCARVWELQGCPERFRGVLYRGVGHEWTAQMWREGLSWLERWIGTRPAPSL